MARVSWPSIWLCLLLCWPLSGAASWWRFGNELPEVAVAGPYVEWRTGPGSGYPVFHVSERGERLQLILQRTRWIMVRDVRGRQGWVSQDELAAGAVGQDGQPFVQLRPDFEHFQQRTLEWGGSLGDFGGASVLGGWASWHMTSNISAELGFSQVLGSRSEIRLINLSLLHQPWPHWRWSPYFSLGGGFAWISPKAVLASTERRNNPTAHAGVGLRYYLTDRYFLRAEVREYKVFTDRATNEEAMEWKIGLGLFF